MSNPNLPAGFSFITVKGKQCTAIPKIQGAGGGGGAAQSSAAPPSTSPPPPATTAPASTTSISTTAQATTTSPPPPPPPAVATSAPPAPPPVAPIPPPPATTAPPAIPLPTAAPNVEPPPPQTSAAPPPVPAPAPPAVVPPSTPAQTTTPIPIVTPNPAPSTPSPVQSPDLNPIPALPASRATTPTESSGTPIAIPQSEAPAEPTLSRTTLSTARASSAPPKATALPPVPNPGTAAGTKGPTDGGISSSPRTNAGPVIGGVIGSFALFALLAFLIFFIMKRRRRRESFLTPLTTANRDEFYRDEKSRGPMSTFENDNDEKWTPGERLKATAVGLQMGLIGLGAKLKRTMTSRSDSPSVNLNRGNSQFLDGPVPTHSRNNSEYSDVGKPGFKERTIEWWAKFKRRHMPMLAEPEDPFVSARFPNEKKAQANNPSPDFSQLLGMDDRELQLRAERNGTRVESSSSLPPLGNLGSLGLSTFKPLQDPFADPKAYTGYDSRQNPFADPIPQPQPSISKQTDYVTNVRRSRGMSISNENAAAASRYPSTLPPSRDSYRDTVFSAFTTTTRRGKGRSDPFDLERPELWRRTNNQNFESPAGTGHSRAPSLSGGDANLNVYGAPVIPPNQNPASAYTQPLGDRVKSNASYDSSKYSSGVDSLAGWGDPGPDLGPGSSTSSLKSGSTAPGKAK